jgi:hypothetical protein
MIYFYKLINMYVIRIRVVCLAFNAADQLLLSVSGGLGYLIK